MIWDIDGVAPALHAVLDDGDRHGVDRCWVLGDLVLFGTHPVEVPEMLDGRATLTFSAGPSFPIDQTARSRTTCRYSGG